MISSLELIIFFLYNQQFYFVKLAVCFLYIQQTFPLTTKYIDLEISIFVMTWKINSPSIVWWIRSKHGEGFGSNNMNFGLRRSKSLHKIILHKLLFSLLCLKCRCLFYGWQKIICVICNVCFSKSICNTCLIWIHHL